MFSELNRSVQQLSHFNMLKVVRLVLFSLLHSTPWLIALGSQERGRTASVSHGITVSFVSRSFIRLILQRRHCRRRGNVVLPTPPLPTYRFTGIIRPVYIYRLISISKFMTMPYYNNIHTMFSSKQLYFNSPHNILTL